jgi:predicted TPR repeat methyltransferase
MDVFSHHYDDWTKTRMDGIRKYIGYDFFKNKTILELGCGHAHNGNIFSNLGAIVTSSDIRQEHLQVANELYPHIQTILMDGENLTIEKKYDIILHWGLLYHLCEIENHLEKVSQNCDILLLETEVSDTDDETFYIQTDENGLDQAFHNKGIRPSPKYVENILTKNGFSMKMIKDPILNSLYHHYDWDITNSKTSRDGLRRFWICWKGENPLLEQID